MRRLNPILSMLFAVTMFACKDPPPPTSATPVESASQTAQRDDREIAKRLAEQKATVDEAFQRQRAREERQRNVDALQAVAKRWADTVSVARSTPRFDIAAQITKLQAIRAEANAVEVDDCTGGARNSLQAAMGTWIEAFSLFQKEKGESTESTTQKVQEAETQLRAAYAESAACLSK